MVTVTNFKKLKVKFSLCLTKYYAMKTYPALDKIPRHEDIWRSGSIAPRILKLGARWRCRWVSRPGSFKPVEREAGNHKTGDWLVLRAGLDTVARKKNP